MQFRLRVQGEKRFFESLDRLIDVIKDQRKRGWQRNVDVRLDFERRFLDSEGNGRWVPLNDNYLLRKVEEVGQKPILQFFGRLHRSLTEEGAPDFVREETATSLLVGSADPLARYHHEGAGRLPKREVIVVTDEEGREHLKVIEEDYSNIASSLGFKVA
jgi:hypothetical protein